MPRRKMRNLHGVGQASCDYISAVCGLNIAKFSDLRDPSWFQMVVPFVCSSFSSHDIRA